MATPRYLLKLRTEVEIMQQLGYSLDAVNLKDVFEDDESVHLVMEVRCAIVTMSRETQILKAKVMFGAGV